MRGSRVKTFIFAIIFIGLAFAIINLLGSNFTDNEPPKISIKDEIYWNQKSPIDLNITDNSAVESLKISLSDANSTKIILDQSVNESKTRLELSLKLPKELILDKKQIYKLTIEAKDFNIFGGNKAVKSVNLIIV